MDGAAFGTGVGKGEAGMREHKIYLIYLTTCLAHSGYCFCVLVVVFLLDLMQANRFVRRRIAVLIHQFISLSLFDITTSSMYRFINSPMQRVDNALVHRLLSKQIYNTLSITS